MELKPISTLAALDAAMEAEAAAEPPRKYLGMSGVGHPCARKIWYDWRWFTKRAFSAATLRKFADGITGEAVMAERLRKVPGVELVTHHADGHQIGFVDMEDHFAGHLDGVITGIHEAPATPHVWEHKQVAEAKFKVLVKLKEQNEKAALKQWDAIYYAQAVLYMHYAGLARHFLTVCTPGGREYISVRTEANPKHAGDLIRKVESIINAETPPDRAFADPAHFQCKWCDHRDVCHRGATPQKTCRSCAQSEPCKAGAWRCKRFDGLIIPLDYQQAGCNEWQPIRFA